jgi:hypothetical protein
LWVLQQIAASALPSRWLLCWTYLRPESKFYCKNLVLITEGKIHAYTQTAIPLRCVFFWWAFQHKLTQSRPIHFPSDLMFCLLIMLQ